MGILKVRWCPTRTVKIKSLFYDSKIGLDTESISFYLTIGSSSGFDMLLIASYASFQRLVWIKNFVFKSYLWCPRRKSLFYDSKIGLSTKSISFYLTVGSSCGCDMSLIGWLRIFSTVGLNKKVCIQNLFKYEYGSIQKVTLTNRNVVTHKRLTYSANCNFKMTCYDTVVDLEWTIDLVGDL